MQTAKYKVNNSEQNAFQFGQLTPDEIALYQLHMVCKGCGAPAYYRGPTRNGRAPCFCGHHAIGCPYAANQSVAASSRDSNLNRGISANPWQRIVVDLSYGIHQTNNPAAPRAFENHAPDQRNAAEHGTEVRPETRRRPSSLLNELINSPQFSESRQRLVIDGFGETTVADFFVNLGRYSPDHINQFHGYWGRIESVCMGSTGELWLNSVGFYSPNVCIPQDLVSEFLKRNRLHHTNQWRLEGAYLLVIGVLKLSREGILYIEANDLSNLAVSSAPDH